jgi:tetratricopeptide (TPR) repeat protein
MNHDRVPHRTRLASWLLIALVPLFLAGCGIPVFPIPIISFAPHTEMLPEKEETSLVQTALAGQSPTRALRVALRGGRVLQVVAPKSDASLIASLPSAALKQEFDSSYVPPFKFRQLAAGSRHYYNFTITPEFEAATSHYLNGRGEEAIAAIDRILANDKDNSPTLRWQASYLKVNVLIMMGRPDAAERETAALEKYEIAAMGKNHTSRALRAEVKYWAGDLEGAIEDAAQVVRAFGDWRYIAAYSTPPLDQVELARCVTAQARADIVLGLALLAKGLKQEALPWLELANQTMNNVLYTSRHPINSLYFQPPEEIFWGRGMSLVALGTALLAIDPDSPRATTTFAQANEFFAALGFQAGPVLIESFKAQALAWAGRHERAARQAETGLALAEKLGLIDYLWRLEALRGRELMAVGDDGTAEQALRRAQSVIDLMAGTMASDDAKVRFGIGKESITRNLVTLDLRRNDLPRLFEDMERGRARSFVALLANRSLASGRGGTLIGRIRALDRNIQTERQRKNALSAQDAGDAGREHRLLEERSALVAELRVADADLADALAVSAVDLATVQAALPPTSALIYALPADDAQALSFLIVTARTAQLQRLELTPPQLKTLLDDFNIGVNAGDSAAQQAALEKIRQALRFDAWPAADAIYFVPSGPTHFIPWGGLDTRFAVAVLPNGGWLARSQRAAPKAVRAAIVGDPEFGGVLPQLPGARQEAEALANLYAATALIGPHATETALRRSVGDGVDVLHLATHALFDARYPLQSSLLLSDGKRAAPLTAERLFAEPLEARLVILSACETGMGMVVGGDDLLGLTRSFYLGGASSVISSLWAVDDEATKLFMATFHRHARDGHYGRAWLAARDAVRAKGYPPSAFAAFVLGGSLGRGG